MADMEARCNGTFLFEDVNWMGNVGHTMKYEPGVMVMCIGLEWGLLMACLGAS
jgi:hypothetical protein